MIIKEQSRLQWRQTEFCWDKMTELLNAKGPSVKTAFRWCHWFSGYKLRLKTKLESGAKPTRLEKHVVLPEKRIM